MTLVFLVLTAHAGKWSDAPTDVEVVRTLPASAEAVHAEVADLRAFSGILPPDCATDWVIRHPSSGVDATADVRYTLGPLRRKLTAVITRDEPGRLFQIEHKGPRGWYTRVQYAPVEGGTEVTLMTPLAAPPWPLKGVFHRKVRPALLRCYEQALETLEQRVTDAAPTPASAP